MADNVAITAGAGTTVATDELTINATPAQVQRVKLVAGKDGEYTGDVGGRNVDGDSNRSAIFTDVRSKLARLPATPTVSTSPAYSAKDAVGGLLTFSNAVRASGGACRIDSVQVVDKSQQRPDLELILFDRSVTAPTDNLVFNPSDTELTYVVGVIYIGGWSDLSTNSVTDIPVGRDVVLNGTDLYGVLITRSTPTFASTSDIVVTVNVLQY